MSDETTSGGDAGAVDLDTLRDLAERTRAPMTCGGHCQECNERNDAHHDFRAAVTPEVLTGLLDRLEPAEAAVKRVADLAWEFRRRERSRHEHR